MLEFYALRPSYQIVYKMVNIETEVENKLHYQAYCTFAHQHSGQIQLHKTTYLHAVEIYCEINYQQTTCLKKLMCQPCTRIKYTFLLITATTLHYTTFSFLIVVISCCKCSNEPGMSCSCKLFAANSSYCSVFIEQ